MGVKKATLPIVDRSRGGMPRPGLDVLFSRSGTLLITPQRTERGKISWAEATRAEDLTPGVLDNYAERAL